MINHESEIALLLVSLAAIYVIKRSFESQQKEAKKKIRKIDKKLRAFYDDRNLSLKVTKYFTEIISYLCLL